MGGNTLEFLKWLRKQNRGLSDEKAYFRSRKNPGGRIPQTIRMYYMSYNETTKEKPMRRRVLKVNLEKEPRANEAEEKDPEEFYNRMVYIGAAMSNTVKTVATAAIVYKVVDAGLFIIVNKALGKTVE